LVETGARVASADEEEAKTYSLGPNYYFIA
jgi:hypothetical protein